MPNHNNVIASLLNIQVQNLPLSSSCEKSGSIIFILFQKGTRQFLFSNATSSDEMNSVFNHMTRPLL